MIMLQKQGKEVLLYFLRNLWSDFTLNMAYRFGHQSIKKTLWNWREARDGHKIRKGIKDFSYEEKLAKVGLITLEKESLWGDMKAINIPKVNAEKGDAVYNNGIENTVSD